MNARKVDACSTASSCLCNLLYLEEVKVKFLLQQQLFSASRTQFVCMYSPYH